MKSEEHEYVQGKDRGFFKTSILHEMWMCAKCGKMKPRDGSTPKPCRGRVKVGLREDAEY